MIELKTMTNKPKSNDQKAATSINFEESINALEGLVNALENGDLALEESLSTFEKGIRLTKECQQQLILFYVAKDQVLSNECRSDRKT